MQNRLRWIHAVLTLGLLFTVGMWVATVAAKPAHQLDDETQMTVDAAVANLFTQTATAPTPLPMTITVQAAFHEAQTATAQPEGIDSIPDILNINTATQEQLETLPRIGPVLAERIIAYREENGDYMTLDDLDAVNGIGPATLEAIADLIVFED